MPAELSLLIGSARSGKSQRLLADYLNALQETPLQGGFRCVWLAPNATAASVVRRGLAAGASRALLEPGVATFRQFVGQVASASRRSHRALNPVEQRRLLRLAVESVAEAGGLKFFATAALRPGFATQLLRTIAEWKRQDVWAETLEARLGPRASARERETVALYHAYQRMLSEAQWYDAEGLFWAARDALRADAGLMRPLGMVAVDGFTDFTAAEYDILRLLADRAQRVAISLPLEEGTRRDDLFLKTRQTVERLGEIGRWNVVSARVDADRDDWEALSRVAREMFGDAPTAATAGAPPPAGIERVRILSAPSFQAELERVAREVKALLCGGEDPEGLVVALRSPADHAARLRATFADFGVPILLDSPRRLASAPGVRSVVRAWRLQVDDWPYRDLVAVVSDRNFGAFDRLPEGCASCGPLVRSPRAATERWVREAQLPQGREPLLDRLERQLQRWQRALDDGRGDEAALRRIAEATVAAAMLRQLAAALDASSAEAPQRAWIERLTVFAGALALRGEPSADATDRHDVPLRDVRAWAEVLADLERLEGRLPRRPRAMSLTSFLDHATDVAEQASCRESRDPTGRVRVMAADAARGSSPRHLWLAGLNERSFPAAVRRSRLASDADAASEDAGASDSSEEMLLFYQLATRPSKSLCLSYTALDAKGLAASASPYLEELRRCLGGLPEPLAIDEQESAGRGDPPLGEGEARRSAVARALDGDPGLLAQTARAPSPRVHGQALLDALESIAWRGRAGAFGPNEGLLEGAAIIAALSRRFGHQHHWSASQLETYAECRFKFFGRHLLQLEPPPDARLQSDFRSRGSLLHDALALFHQEVREWTDGDVNQFAEAFVQRVDAAFRRRRAEGVEGALREIERRQIAGWAEQLADQHAAYRNLWQQLDEPLRPTHLELRFGPRRGAADDELEANGSLDAPYELSIAGESLKFTGRIDRIDVGRVGDRQVFTVIDYKTGDSAVVDPQHILSGKQLQMPLYVMVVAELLLAKSAALPLAAGFWAVGGGGFNRDRSGRPKLPLSAVADGTVRLLESWDDLRQSTVELVARLVADIRGGRFPVFNDDPECGRFCELRTVCRINQVRSLGKTVPRPPSSEAAAARPAAKSSSSASRRKPRS